MFCGVCGVVDWSGAKVYSNNSKSEDRQRQMLK
jgi:hypothetical protein